MRNPFRRTLAIALSSFILLLGAGCHRICPIAEWEQAPLRVMTYNVFVDRPNLSVVEGILRQARADVVFLQEVTTEWVPTFAHLSDLYPYQESAADIEGRGNVLISRLPLLRARRLSTEYGWHGAWLAVVSTSQGEVQLLCVHLKPPLQENGEFTFDALVGTGPIHRREIETFAREVDFTRPLIVLGDFNEGETGAATNYLKRHKLISALSEFDSLTPTWTWVDSPLLTRRLDHIFHTSALQARYAAVLPGGVSDHQPVVAAFELPNMSRLPNVTTSTESTAAVALGDYQADQN